MDNETKAATAGATTGGIASIAAVSALGVPGLSAIGITSGLSTLGGFVGGGMACGLATVAFAPLAAGALGFGIYKWLK